MITIHTVIRKYNIPSDIDLEVRFGAYKSPDSGYVLRFYKNKDHSNYDHSDNSDSILVVDSNKVITYQANEVKQESTDIEYSSVSQMLYQIICDMLDDWNNWNFGTERTGVKLNGSTIRTLEKWQTSEGLIYNRNIKLNDLLNGRQS